MKIITMFVLVVAGSFLAVLALIGLVCWLANPERKYV